MEPMIVLRSEPKDAKRTARIFLRLILVIITQQAANGEFSAFDPDLGSFAHGLECHETAISAAHKAIRVIWVFYGPRVRLQLPAK